MCASFNFLLLFFRFECWSTINTRFVAIYSNAGRMRIEKECYMLALTLNFRLIVIHNTKGAICWIFKSHCHAKEHAICIFSLRENARYLRWLAKLTVSFRSQFNMWYKFTWDGSWCRLCVFFSFIRRTWGYCAFYALKSTARNPKKLLTSFQCVFLICLFHSLPVSHEIFSHADRITAILFGSFCDIKSLCDPV